MSGFSFFRAWYLATLSIETSFSLFSNSRKSGFSQNLFYSSSKLKFKQTLTFSVVRISGTRLQ